MLAFAAAAGAAGGPERGAIAGFVLGLMFDLGTGRRSGRRRSRWASPATSPAGATSSASTRQWWLAAIFVGVGRRGRRAAACRWCGASSASQDAFSTGSDQIVPRRRLRGGGRQPAPRAGQPLGLKLGTTGVEGCRPMNATRPDDGTRFSSCRLARLVAMAIDRRATRLGVLGLVGVILFSLIGVRLWFLQTVKADELQAADRPSPDAHRAAAPRARPDLRRRRPHPRRQPAHPHRRRRLAAAAQAHRPARDLPPPVGAGSACRSRTWRRASTPRSTARSCRCRSSTGVDERRSRRRCSNASRTSPACQCSRSGSACYPYAPHAAHVVGYMGAITEDQKDDYLANGYLLNERVGQFGVEKSMESVLHGTWGKQVYEVDAAKRPVRLIEDVPPINGFDVQLTIDLDYQQYAEQALETTLEGAAHADWRPNPKVLKPDGELEKMASAAARRSSRTRRPAGSEIVMDYADRQHHRAWRATRRSTTAGSRPACRARSSSEIFPTRHADPIDPDQSILVNRAVQGRYNLGSTFKPFTAYRRPQHRVDVGRRLLSTTPARTRIAHRSTRADVDAGLVRCEYKNATCAGTQRPCRYGRSTSTSARRLVATRSSTASARLIMVAQRLQAGAAGAGRAVRIRLRHRHRAAVRVRRHGSRPGAQDAVRRPRRDQRGRRPGYYAGDNVQLAIGQGLLSATPMQLAIGLRRRSPTAGFVLQPKIVKAIWNPGVPDSEPASSISRQGTIFEDRQRSRAVRQIPMPDEIRDCRSCTGLRRVVGRRRARVSTPTSTTRPPARISSSTTRATRSRSPARPAPPRAPTTSRGTTRRCSPRSASTRPRPYVVTAYLEKSGLRLAGRRPGRQVHVPRAVGADAPPIPCAVRSARHQRHCRRALQHRWPTRRAGTARKATPCRCSRDARPTDGAALALTFLSRKADSGLGNIRSSPGDPSPQRRLGAADHAGRADGDGLPRRLLGVAHPHRRRPVRVRHPPGGVRDHRLRRDGVRHDGRLRVVQGARRLPLRPHDRAAGAAVVDGPGARARPDLVRPRTVQLPAGGDGQVHDVARARARTSPTSAATRSATRASSAG